MTSKIPGKELELFLKKNNIHKYRLCGFLEVHPRSVDRWLTGGIDKIYFEYLKTNIGKIK